MPTTNDKVIQNMNKLDNNVININIFTSTYILRSSLQYFEYKYIFKSSLKRAQDCRTVNTIASAFGGPFALVNHFLIDPNLNNIINELNNKFNEIKAFFENLKNRINRANVDIDDVKNKLKDELRVILELKVQTG